MPEWQSNFLAGVIGAAAPEIVRQMNILRNGGLFTWTPPLIVFSILYAGIAGFIAAILPSANLYAAFYSGLSTDVLITKAHASAAGTKAKSTKVRQQKSSSVPGKARLSPVDSFLDAL